MGVRYGPNFNFKIQRYVERFDLDTAVSKNQNTVVTAPTINEFELRNKFPLFFPCAIPAFDQAT